MKTRSSTSFKKLTRRTFIKSSAALAMTTALSNSRVLGANERINIGIIGFGLIGRIHTRNFKDQPDATIIGVAETYRPRLDAAADLIGGSITPHSPFLRPLHNKKNHGHLLATPGHRACVIMMM